MPRMSVATIKNPEFINLQPLEINPLMSACEIKVMYVGQNRNHSFITKEVATEMSKTLRGAPIVGWYREDKGDFADHGDRITIDNDGIKFESMTRPYGFVAPDAKVWFQEFEDTDDFGNKVNREYLMTTGYLWTSQYPECKSATEGKGKPHSMELDDDTLDGKWSTDLKSGMDFFIVNDAIFSKLCILGDDVEPCFEGSSVTGPEISKSFTMVDDDFKQSLYTMMQQLKFALEGGQQSMAVQKIDGVNTDFSAQQGNVEQPATTENQNFTKDSSKGEEKKDEEKKKEDYAREDDKKKEEDEDKKKDFAKEDEKKEQEVKDEDKEDEKKKDDKYSLLEAKFTELEQKYSALEADYRNLVSFKNDAENEKKDELIKSFYMLSDEDKKDVIENKSKYSLDEIESKLSVICVRKKVNFDLDNSSNSDNKVEDKPATTFNLESSGESVPAWISALINTQNSRNI